MNLQEIRLRLEVASRAKPVLRRLLDHKLERADLLPVSDAVAELGYFKLAHFLRAVHNRPSLETSKQLAKFWLDAEPGELELFFAEWGEGLQNLDVVNAAFRKVFR